MNDVVFLFGAGAEYGEKSFGLPSGPDYTLKTMQQKRDKLYSVLRKFYTSERMGHYVKGYQPEFLFKRESHTFQELIFRAAKDCIENGSTGGAEFADYVKLVSNYQSHNLEWDNEDQKEARRKIKEEAKKVYDLLINDDTQEQKTDAGDKRSNEEKTLKNYLSFYGAVEKDFGAIIDPNKVGRAQFWRVINYYWSAFFTILEPLCKNQVWYQNCNGDPPKFYEYVLNNVARVIDDVYAKYDYSRVESNELQIFNYYLNAIKYFPDSMAITTNYTPFVEHYFPRNAYLAGRLSEFEFPTELDIKDIRDTEVLSTNFIFPFLMTQAPVKPIISPKQVREYCKALKYMEVANTLIIIGYSLSDADNHINAMLREFATNEKKNIIYCFFDPKGETTDNVAQEYVLQSLKLPNDVSNVKVLRNKGDSTTLMHTLKKIIGDTN